MEDITPVQQQLRELDTRMRKAMSDCIPFVEDIRNISKNQENDSPLTEEGIQIIYKERLHVFDCMENGKDLPDIISDRCIIQCVLLLELMLIESVQKTIKKFPQEQPQEVNMTPRAFKRYLEKKDKEMLKQATPYIIAIENLGEDIIMFCEMYKEDYPEVVNKYK